MEKLKGIRTYIILGVAVILGALDSYNAHCLANSALCSSFDVPPIVYVILSSLGIYTRSLAGK